jgi:hypothetical protein
MRLLWYVSVLSVSLAGAGAMWILFEALRPGGAGAMAFMMMPPLAILLALGACGIAISSQRSGAASRRDAIAIGVSVAIAVVCIAAYALS